MRSVAKVWSVVTITLVVAFILGEGVTASTPHEWLGLLFFPLGICLGMVIAWRRERLGGAVTVGSLAAFYVVYLATAGVLPPGWAWLAFAGPGFLFLVCGLSSNGRRATADGAAAGR